MRSLMPSARSMHYVRTQANSLMTSTVTIYRPGPPTFDNVTGMMTATSDPVPILNGFARVHVIQGSIRELGEESMTFTGTSVSIPWDTTPVPQVDDLIDIEDSDDPALIGRVYRIVDVQEGGIFPLVLSLTVTGTERDVSNI